MLKLSSLELTLFKALAYTKLEYASSVCDRVHTSLMHSLQMAQNNSVRFILSNNNRTASTTTTECSFKLPPLLHGRQIIRLNLFWKLYHPYMYIEILLNEQNMCYVVRIYVKRSGCYHAEPTETTENYDLFMNSIAIND